MSTEGPATATQRASEPASPKGPSALLVVVTLLLAAVLGAVTGALFALAGPGGGDDGDGATGPTATTVTEIEPASVQSFDPVGGSGLIDEGDGWRTQTYTTAAFGALKPGVGLVLDLGEPRDVSTVTLPTSTPGLTVELRAGDQMPADSAAPLEVVDSATTEAEGTELSGTDAGEHRYWMVWITSLAPRGDGFGADLTTPVVHGS